MVGIADLRALVVMVVVVASSPTSARQEPFTPRNPGETLFVQTAAEALNRDFADSNVSFLLMDARSGEVLTSRWEDRDALIPMGSLVKPFTAIAYAAQHGYRYPTHVCRGTASACWRPRGHGNVDLTSAIAYSCNSYFRMLAANVSLQDVSRTAKDFGLEGPDTSASAPTFVGLGDDWRISPARIARAYAELVSRRRQPGIRELVDGMALSASIGTGSGAGRVKGITTVLAKTGTAPCTHRTRAPGDGLAVAVWPAEAPHYVLLVRVHGHPGTQAAATVGAMLRDFSE